MKRLYKYFFITVSIIFFGSVIISCNQDNNISDYDTEIKIGSKVDDFITLFHTPSKNVYYYEWKYGDKGGKYRILKHKTTHILDNKPFKEYVRYFSVDKNNPYYTSINGILFNKDATVLLCCPQDYQAKEYIVPASVTTIAETAFAGNKNIKTINLSLTGKTIEHPLIITAGAFENCKSLESIILPKFYEYSGKMIATKLEITNLSPFVTLYIGPDVNDYTTLLHETIVYSDGYSEDLDDNKPKEEEIQNFVVDKNNPFYLSINGVLFNKDATELIRCPQDYQHTEYAMPSSVVTIAEKAFFNNNNLKRIYLNNVGKDRNRQLTIKSAAFKSCLSLEYVAFPDFYTKSEDAFWDCPKFKLWNNTFPFQSNK